MDYRKCVVVVVMDSKAKLLAGRRSDHKEIIQLPQGGINKEETPLEAAKRELYEETGIEATDLEFYQMGDETSRYDFPEGMVGGKADLYTGQELFWVCFRFKGDPSLIDLKKAVDNEFCELKWARPSEVIDSVTSWKRSAYQKGLSQFNFEKGELACQE